MGEKKDKANNIKVLVRVRPLNSREKNEDGKICVEFDPLNKGKLVLGPKNFNYDWVGGLDTKQQDIFDYIGVPLVNTCLEGKNFNFLGVRSHSCPGLEFSNLFWKFYLTKNWH